MKTLILNSSNIIDSNNGLFQFNFTSGSIKIEKGQKLALANVQMYYSNFNITSSYDNNQFSYTWIDGTVVNVSIPDSFLDIDGLRSYVQFIMQQNGHYFINPSGKYVYLFDLLINTSRYGVDMILYAVSEDLQTTNEWTKPLGASWLTPSILTILRFDIKTIGFGKLIGFNKAVYPLPGQWSSSSGVSFVNQSTFSPQIAPVASFIMTCNLIQNNYTVPSNLLYSFTPDVRFGSRFNIAPNQFAFIDCQPGSYNNFTVQIIDQDYKMVKFQDPNTVIMLVISDVGENV